MLSKKKNAFILFQFRIIFLLRLDWIQILQYNQKQISGTSFFFFLFYWVWISSRIIRSDIWQYLKVYVKYSIFCGHIFFQKRIWIQYLNTSDCHLLMSKYKYLNKTQTILIQMKSFSISAAGRVKGLLQGYHRGLHGLDFSGSAQKRN